MKMNVNINNNYNKKSDIKRKNKKSDHININKMKNRYYDVMNNEETISYPNPISFLKKKAKKDNVVSPYEIRLLKNYNKSIVREKIQKISKDKRMKQETKNRKLALIKKEFEYIKEIEKKISQTKITKNKQKVGDDFKFLPLGALREMPELNKNLELIKIKDFLSKNEYSYVGDPRSDVDNSIFIKKQIKASTLKELKTKILAIHSEQKINAYRFNVNIGTLTKKYVARGKERFIVHNHGLNTNFFNKKNRNGKNGITPLVRNTVELKKHLAEITIRNLEDFISGLTKESGETLLGVGSFIVEIAKTTKTLGCSVKLPTDLSKSKSIIKFNDLKYQHCFLYCLAKHYNPKKQDIRLVKQVKHLHSLKFEGDYKSFEGVTYKDIEEYEDILKLNINIYEYTTSMDNIIPFSLSTKTYDDKMDILKYKDHLMLITKLDKVIRSYCCEKCKTFFSDKRKLNKHIKNKVCKNGEKRTEVKYAEITKPWMSKESDLKMLLIKYNLYEKYKNKMNLDNILTYDFEASKDTTIKKDGVKLNLIGKQVPMSYSICYKVKENGESRTVTRIIDEFENDPQKLVKKFVDDIVKISVKSYENYKLKFEELYQKINYRNSKDLLKFMQATALPCIGFNSAKYDIKLLTHFGFYQELFNHDLWKVLEDNLNLEDDINRFIIPEKVVVVNTVRLLDQMLFTPTNLDRFIKGFYPDAEIGKLVFPHDTFKLEEHKRLSFKKKNFPREFFRNSFRNEDIDLDKYNQLFKIARKNNVKTMRDFLVLYNECDVKPFLVACERFRDIVRSQQDKIGYIDAYNDTFGMPTLASKALINCSQLEYWKEFNAEWDSYGKNENDNYAPIITQYQFKKLFQNYKKQDESNENVKGKTCFTIDWYLNQLKKQNGKCYQCRCKLNNSVEEKMITLDRIDNFKPHIESNMLITCKSCNVSRKTGSIFEAEYWNKRSQFMDKYKNNLLCVMGEDHKDIFELMRNKGITGGPSMVFHRYHEVNKSRIQHTEYNDGKFKIGEAHDLVKYICSMDANSLYPSVYMNFMPCGVPELLEIKEDTHEKIMDDTLFGFVECSLKVKEESYNDYSDHPPFYITKEINGQKKLSSYMECEKILISTDLYKWYLSHSGIICTEITKMIKYNKSKPFEKFVLMGCDMRRDNTNPIAGDVWKLMLNSSFGKMAQNNHLYTNTTFTTDKKKVDRLVNKWNFKTGSEYGEDKNKLYEIVNSKIRVQENCPIQGACQIYSGAKQRMLEFYYDFVDKYIERKNYQLMYQDTDSCWLAFTQENPFETLIKPELVSEYELEKEKYLAISDYDQRTAGLFKNEYGARKVVCLSAKSYFAEPFEGNTNKLGAKGIQKSNNLTMEMYENALINGVESVAVNKGFRFTKSLGLQMYRQEKRGVNSDYDKRHLLENKINTYPRSFTE